MPRYRQGFTPASIILDTPLNKSDEFDEGGVPRTMRTNTSAPHHSDRGMSRNVVTVQILLDRPVLCHDYLRRFNMDAQLPPSIPRWARRVTYV